MQQDPSQPRASDLREYLAILRYRKWTILSITALVVASALFFSVRQTRIYESETRVLVRPTAPAPGIAPQPVNLDTERAIVDSAAVAQIVRRTLEVDAPIDRLLEDLEVAVETNTEILSIRYADPDPVRAQELATAFAQSYLAFRREQATREFQTLAGPIRDRLGEVRAELRDNQQQQLEAEDEEVLAELESEEIALISEMGALEQELNDLESARAAQGASGDIVQPATIPDSPARPDHLRNGLLALAVGLVLGVGLAFLRERLDERLASREDLEVAIGAPVLATIPRARGNASRSGRRGDGGDLVTLTAPTSAPAEAYRTLRTNVQFIARTGELKVIAVVSPAAGEGKTMTTANLAASLGRAGKRVIVVSTDLRKPRIHRCFNVRPEPGVTDVLTARKPLTDSLQRPRAENVLVLSTGPLPSSPAEAAASEAMEHLIEELRGLADFVVLDTPPLLAVSDGVSLASRCDGVLIVADARATARGALAHAREQLEQVGATILGGVLNNFDASRARYSSHYHGSYYGAYRPREDRRSRPRPVDDPGAPDTGQMWS